MNNLKWKKKKRGVQKQNHDVYGKGQPLGQHNFNVFVENVDRDTHSILNLTVHDSVGGLGQDFATCQLV